VLFFINNSCESKVIPLSWSVSSLIAQMTILPYQVRKPDTEGKAELSTVSGGKLTAMMNGSHNIALKDENGGVANISTYDVYQANGVIHVLDAVVLPKCKRKAYQHLAKP
jgi:uncharacterized surface protein with fasciclin (FAS1) repeats